MFIIYILFRWWSGQIVIIDSLWEGWRGKLFFIQKCEGEYVVWQLFCLIKQTLTWYISCRVVDDAVNHSPNLDFMIGQDIEEQPSVIQLGMSDTFLIVLVVLKPSYLNMKWFIRRTQPWDTGCRRWNMLNIWQLQWIEPELWLS